MRWRGKSLFQLPSDLPIALLWPSKTGEPSSPAGMFIGNLPMLLSKEEALQLLSSLPSERYCPLVTLQCFKNIFPKSSAQSPSHSADPSRTVPPPHSQFCLHLVILAAFFLLVSPSPPHHTALHSIYCASFP